MTVLEGPEPGFATDVSVWRDCQTRARLTSIMDRRAAAGQRRLKLYADKIYNDSDLVEAAWSKRHGAVQDWMTIQNSIMSKIRVSVEWAFGRLCALWAFTEWRNVQKVQSSPVATYKIVGALLSNCHVSLYGNLHQSVFGITSPTLDDIFDQD